MRWQIERIEQLREFIAQATAQELWIIRTVDIAHMVGIADYERAQLLKECEQRAAVLFRANTLATSSDGDSSRPLSRRQPIRRGLSLMVAFFMLSAVWGYGATPPMRLCVAALYGETAGEGYANKLATACALRNRVALGKGLGGVYGVSSPLLRRVNARAWAECERAWRESARGDVTRGATLWACRGDLGKGYLRGARLVARVGGHWFFREARV
jgi:hypothetical protein